MKQAIIYREIGYLPDVSAWAQGLFTHGYSNDFQTVLGFNPASVPKVDLVTVAGGRSRYGGRNNKIIQAYRALGVPVFILEFGRLVPNTLLTLLNSKPWLPPIECPPDRIPLCKFEYTPQPRGTNILVCGQRQELDNELLPVLESIKTSTQRRIVYRPHPNQWRLQNQPDLNFLHLVDEISEPPKDDPNLGEPVQRSLQHDLDQSWCVVTHSSLAALQGLLRGIPAITGNEFVAAELAHPYSFGRDVEWMKPPDEQELHSFLCRFTHTIWADEEIREGQAFGFLKRFL